MGNIFIKKSTNLEEYVISTKRDIMMNYDLTNENQVALANNELLESFSKFNKKDIEYVKTKLFILNDPDYIC